MVGQTKLTEFSIYIFSGYFCIIFCRTQRI